MATQDGAIDFQKFVEHCWHRLLLPAGWKPPAPAPRPQAPEEEEWLGPRPAAPARSESPSKASRFYSGSGAPVAGTLFDRMLRERDEARGLAKAEEAKAR